jgi:chromosome segregation ATPase
MTQITCFNNTSLEELKTKFNDLTKDVTTEEQQQEIGITLVLDKYKQLQKQINALRKASNLSQSPIKTIESLIDIKAKYSKTVQDLQTKINSFNNELTNIQKEEDNQVAKQHEIEVDSKLVKIAIGDKTFTVEIAKTEEEKEIGLSNRESLDNNKGMLFVFDEPDEVSF